MADLIAQRQQLGVHAALLVAAELGQANRADHDQRDNDEHEQRGDQLDPQGDPAGCLPHRLHAAGGCGGSEPSHAGQDEGNRSTYPTPRRVWISRGSVLSTLRRSTDT